MREEIGGEFIFIPEKGHIARIKIGADQEKWHQIVNVLLHEAQELAYQRIGGRWTPAYDMANDHAAYLFSLSHTQFTEATARVAEFVAGCLPDLEKAWKKWKKEQVK